MTSAMTAWLPFGVRADLLAFLGQLSLAGASPTLPVHYQHSGTEKTDTLLEGSA